MQNLIRQPLIQHLLPIVEERIRSWELPESHPLNQALLDLVDAGGKRIRPILCLLFGELLHAPHDPLVDFAAALEVVHVATLVHDDLIDHSDMRRGKPTLHSTWPVGLTVLAGDFLFAWAANLATATNSAIVMEAFSKAIMLMAQGEISQQTDKQGVLSLSEYESRIYRKTAALMEVSCVGPALLSKISGKQLDSVREFGKYIGLAFQAMDDILDYTGVSADLGKPAGWDLSHGLMTLPAVIYANDHPEDPNITLFLQSSQDHAVKEKLFEKILASRAIAQSRVQANSYGEKAIQALKAFPADPYRDALEGIVQTVLSRTS